MIRFPAVLATFALALLAAQPAAAGSSTFFHTPSKGIYCVYHTGPAFLRCDTSYPTRFSGKKTCRHGDFGQAFGMSPRGRARALCVSDSTHAGRRVLRYGTTRRFGPYHCTSMRDGLTCSNDRQHGWFLSREKQKLF
jgi:hypothetical protein